MNLEIVSPYGYCAGVILAIKKAESLREKYPGETIYVIGSLVHSEEIQSRFSSEGFEFLDEKNGDLKRQLESIPDGSPSLFSAHGHAPELDEIARRKKLRTIDATCEFVHDNALRILSALGKGHEVIYIGEKYHAESEGAIGISPLKIHLYTPEFGLSGAKIEDRSPLIVSQTTMGIDDLKKAKEELLSLFPKAIFADERCNSTKLRQEGILRADPSNDLFVILGSPTSNNSKKLGVIAKASFPSATIVVAPNLAAIRKIDLSGHKKALLASGASTSPETFEAVKRYLADL